MVFPSYRNFGSRTKRISDYCFEQVRLIYQALSIDFDPTWYPYLTAIPEASYCNANDLAATLGISQPGISKMLKKLAQNEMVSYTSSLSDKRHKTIALTPAARQSLLHIAPIVDIMNQVIASIDQPASNTVAALDNIEECFKEFSLFRRVITFLARETHLQLSAYNKSLHHFYEQYNRQWLEAFFHVEAHDEEVLSDPETHVLKKGGKIYIAHLLGYPVGGFTLMPDKEMLELAKMYVPQSLQGYGIGKQLLAMAIQEAERSSFETLYLVSARKLRAAIHLYQSAGFIEVPLDEMAKASYQRTDIKMAKHIRNNCGQ